MEKNRRKDMGIGKMAGEAAIEVMKNENVQNKTESVVSYRITCNNGNQRTLINP